jgi:hypothetical protein
MECLFAGGKTPRWLPFCDPQKCSGCHGISFFVYETVRREEIAAQYQIFSEMAIREILT